MEHRWDPCKIKYSLEAARATADSVQHCVQCCCKQDKTIARWTVPPYGDSPTSETITYVTFRKLRGQVILNSDSVLPAHSLGM